MFLSGYDVLSSASKRVRPTLIYASGEKVPSRGPDLPEALNAFKAYWTLRVRLLYSSIL